MATDKALTLLAQAQTLLDAVKAELAPAPAPAPQAPAPAPKPVGRTPENPIGAVAGLDYIYVEGDFRQIPDFTKLKAKATGVTTHPRLDLPGREDGVGRRFTGFLNAPTDGEYALYSRSDDGSRLYIGGKVLVDNDAIQGAVEKSGTILLQKGLHAFTLDYFDFNGAQDLLVSWSGPGIAKQPIPASAFFRVPAPTKQAPIAEAKPEPNTTADNFKAILR
jgi:hypothetical protein